ncbi:MAG: nucleotidyltransferase domain-containing protein [Nitrospira defluvii]|nr:nucleotidyltransferase domain-containing protein [Nitrospira defluvii]
MTLARSPQAHSCILKVLVGSHAHGLAGPESDKDFRSVFVIPTVEMFRVGFKYQGTRMMKEEEDETSWEVGHFLQLTLQGHPLVLETLVAPVVTMDDWGAELRQLFPQLWSARNAYDSFMNYCENQRKKMLEKKDGRPAKYAATYLRVLFNLCELLERGTFNVRIADTPIGDTVRRIKDGDYRVGEVIDFGEYWAHEATRRLTACSQQARPDLADAFLIKLRKACLS